MDTRFRPIRGTAGQGSFFNFQSSIRRGGVPSGEAAFIVPEKNIISASWMNTTIFIGNVYESQTQANMMNTVGLSG